MPPLTGQPSAPVTGSLALPERARHRGMITACIICATLLQSLDQTIANVALPYMQGSFSASYDEITWVLTTYITAAAIMTAPVGWLAARFGRKRLFVFCIVGFTITSMLCGAAQSLDQIVAFRLMQGVCSAALVPLSQAILFDIYPHERRGFAMAVWGMGVMIGPILGPTLGGYLTELYNWRYVFYINLPAGVLATLGLILFMPDSAGEDQAAVRLVRLRRAGGRHRRLPNGAGPRQQPGLVHLEGDHYRGRPRWPRHLPVPCAHGLGSETADPPGAVPRRELQCRPGADVRGRHHPGFQYRPHGPMAADPWQLSGRDRGIADGPAGPRQPGHDHPVRPAVDARRFALPRRNRSADAVLVVLGDDGLDARCVRARVDHHNRDPGRRAGTGVHAAAGTRLRDPGAQPAHRGCRGVQPGAQHRCGNRRLRHYVAACPQHTGTA